VQSAITPDQLNALYAVLLSQGKTGRARALKGLATSKGGYRSIGKAFVPNILVTVPARVIYANSAGVDENLLDPRTLTALQTNKVGSIIEATDGGKYQRQAKNLASKLEKQLGQVARARTVQEQNRLAAEIARTGKILKSVISNHSVLRADSPRDTEKKLQRSGATYDGYIAKFNAAAQIVDAARSARVDLANDKKDDALLNRFKPAGVDSQHLKDYKQGNNRLIPPKKLDAIKTKFSAFKNSEIGRLDGLIRKKNLEIDRATGTMQRQYNNIKELRKAFPKQEFKLPSIKDYNIQAKATTRDDGLLRAVYAQAVQMRDAGASQQQANDYIVRTLRSYDVDPGILRQVQQAAAASRTA